MSHNIETITARNLSDYPHLTHGFTTRSVGVSTGHFAGLNFGFKSGDDQKLVSKNYDLLCEHLQISREDLIIADQTHSNNAVYVQDNTQKFSNNDALITNQKSLTIAVLTADCCPILLFDPETNFIAAIHSGWRSAFSGIIQNTVYLLQKHNVTPSNLIAAVFPTIAQTSYEVDESFKQKFLTQKQGNTLFFQDGIESGKYLFDLVSYNVKQLTSCGVRNIELRSDDTFSDPQCFFSYRYATKNATMATGRHLTFISLSI